MANDRLYVRCEFCGAFRFLGKFWPAQIAITLDDMATLRTFMEEHIECNPRYGGPDLDENPGFAIYTEKMRTKTYEKTQHSSPQDAQRQPDPER